MRIRKSIVALMCILMLMVSFAYADVGMLQNETDAETIQPKFVVINTFDNAFSIDSSGKAELYSALDANGGNRTVISAYLQQQQNGQWITVKHWTVEESGTFVELDENWYVTSGYLYRMISYGYVYDSAILLDSDYYDSATIWY